MIAMLRSLGIANKNSIGWCDEGITGMPGIIIMGRGVNVEEVLVEKI